MTVRSVIDMNVFKTNTNAYALSYERECICYLPQELLDVILDKTNASQVCSNTSNSNDIRYYKKKYEYLKKYGILKNKQPLVRLANFYKQNIRDSFYNTPEIVFEVTEACNMKCSYCVYGDMYNNAMHRRNRILHAFEMLNALREIIANRDPVNNKLIVGFYGGEPLLCFTEIKSLIENVQSEFKDFEFSWLMTTNATLLNREVREFCASNRVDLLISLDGDYDHNRKRVYKNGGYTFNDVILNVDRLKSEYPDYFKQRINFSCVNSSNAQISEIISFFIKKYGKNPLISELTTIGAKNEISSIKRQMDASESYVSPEKDIIPFLENLTHNISSDISSLISKSQSRLDANNSSKNSFFRPTGTCYPFGKKIFITAGGVVKPCEKIPTDLNLGTFDGEKFNISFAEIANLYNEIYKKAWEECKSCGKLRNCSLCIFYMPKILTTSKVKCLRKKMSEYDKIGKICQIIEEQPELYKTFIKIRYE